MAKVPLEEIPIDKYSRLKERLEIFAREFFEENNGKVMLPYPTFKMISTMDNL